MTIPFLNALQDTFGRYAARPAVICQGRTTTYAELDALVRLVAARLQAEGLAPGDRVALCTAARLPLLLAHLATTFAGGVALPLNPRFTRDELKFFLANSGARLAVVGPEARSH